MRTLMPPSFCTLLKMRTFAKIAFETQELFENGVISVVENYPPFFPHLESNDSGLASAVEHRLKGMTHDGFNHLIHSENTHLRAKGVMTATWIISPSFF